MTSRLKRKLENIGVDVQSNSSKLTENFCLIGTPLPPLEKSKDSGEFVPLWKQEVRDEQGRRRLHGAFTGGFSAGYYNTVGSKEGWTPSTFSSSRADRASKKQARPEDFMDEEDLAELRDSKKLVDTTEETDIFGGTEVEIARRRGVGEVEKDSITNALESLLPTSKDSVGGRLLKKMGWRPGQGIGPRVTYKQLLAQDGRSIGEGDHIDEEASKHLYAPRDTRTITFHKKENSFGLGYIPGQGLNEVIQGRNGQATETEPNLSAGFGLGALNEAEDDDLDVYDSKIPRESRRMAYDAGEAEEDDNVILQGDKLKGPSKVPVKRTGGTTSAIFRDGRPLVSGFVLFEKPLVENRWFPIPDIPKGWTPDPRRVWAKDISNEQDRIQNTLQASTAAKDHRPWIKGKSADERGSMLGETPLPSGPRSVFDYLSQKDRDRLKNLASSSAPPKAAPPPLVSITIPRTDPHIAQAALKGFQPFTTDPQKQLRYTVYLQSQANASDPQVLRPLPGQSNEDFNKEVSDYAKAAQIFKPVSGAMAGRFASASTMEMIGSTNHGLHRPTKEDYARLDGPKEEPKKEETVEESPKAHAARMGMFGPLTRETKVWQPARLLCRRFGVKDPHPDGVDSSVPDAGEASGGKAKAWQDEVLSPAGVPHVTASTTVADGSDISSAPPTKGSTGKRDLANIGLGEDDEQGKDTLTYERPKKDIFKAIFASDDEDSDEEAGDVEDEPANERATSAHAPPSNSAAPVAESSNSQSHSGATVQRPSEEGKVNLATFKPTFIPKSERKKGGDNGGKVKKDREKKKKGKMVVSFDVEDDSGFQDKRPKEKRRKKEKPEEADDESMWVEKPPPEITKGLLIPGAFEPDEEVNRPQRGRKRAVDFL